MKSRVFMYLFIFSVLIILFQYVNYKNIYDNSNKRVTSYKAQLKTYKDSVTVLQEKIFDLSEFSIEHNEPAISYYEDKGIDTDKLFTNVKEELYEFNVMPGDHKLIPYKLSSDRKMQLNTVKVINHKWIIANFSDGVYWGELLIEYQLNKNNTFTYKVIDSFLYPNK